MNIVKKGLLAATALSFALPVVIANAEENKSILEEITITATKRSENLQSVPISISAFTAGAL